jgi:sRNA-binding regulator protein Hfq
MRAMTAAEMANPNGCDMQGVLQTFHHFVMVATKSSVSVMQHSGAKKAVSTSHVTMRSETN